jgi:hypothetical protein
MTSDDLNRWWALYDALLDLIEGYQESADQPAAEVLAKLMHDAEYTRGVCEAMAYELRRVESTLEAKAQPAPTAAPVDDAPMMRYPAPENAR